MAVSRETILRRMQEELTKATQSSQVNQEQMKEHVMKVHILCELILDQEDKQVLPQMDQRGSGKKEDHAQPSELSGDSIFDF